MSTIGPFGWVKGWNTKASAMTLPRDQYSDAQDIQIVYGDLQKRKGSAAINSSAFNSGAACTGLFDWQTAAGQRYSILVAGNKIGQAADLASSYTDITGAVTITAGQNNQSTFDSLNNIMVRCGGATPDAPIKWTGSGNAAALGGSPPSGNIVKTVNNFMFITGVAATPSRVFWSNVGDPETWGSTNYVDFRLSDGDKVMALSGIYQNLIIFKRRSIGALATTPPSTAASVTLGPLITVPGVLGCVGPLALDTLPDGRIAYLAPNAHVYLFDGSNAEDISDPEPPASNIQPTLDGLNIARLQYAVIRVYPNRNQIWIAASAGTSSTNNVIYVYDYALKAWQSAFTNIAANCMVAQIDSRGSPSHPIIMLTGNYGGFVYEQDKGNTNAESTGTKIDGFATSSIQLDADGKEVLPRSALIPVETQGNIFVNLNYGFDGLTETSRTNQISENGSGGLLDSFILDSSQLAGPATLRRITLLASIGKSASIQMQFRNSNAAEDFTVHPFFLSDEVIV